MTDASDADYLFDDLWSYWLDILDVEVIREWEGIKFGVWKRDLHGKYQNVTKTYMDSRRRNGDYSRRMGFMKRTAIGRSRQWLT